MKIINKIKKNLVFCFIVIIILFLAAITIDFSEYKNSQPNYTVYSTNLNGTKALYDLVGRLGYEVGIYESSSRFLENYNNTTLVVIAPKSNIFNKEIEIKYLKEWIKKGNTMFVIEEKNTFRELDIKKFEATKSNKSDNIFNVGNGKIVILNNAKNYTNTGLKDYDSGVVFIETLELIGNSKVLFNEYYHGIGVEATIWDVLGSTGQLIIIQLCLALIIWIYMKSRRFGKPIEVFEIIKRKENEKLYALSNMYIKARAYKPVFEIYFDNFKTRLARFLGLGVKFSEDELINLSSENKFLESLNVREVLLESRKYLDLKNNNLKKDSKKDSKEMIRIVENIEKIKEKLDNF